MGISVQKNKGHYKWDSLKLPKIRQKKTYTKKELAGQSAKIRKLRTSKYFCLNEAGETVWLTDYDGNSMVNFIERHQKSPFFLYWSPAAVHSPSTEAPESLMKRTTATGRATQAGRRHRLGR